MAHKDLRDRRAYWVSKSGRAAKRRQDVKRRGWTIERFEQWLIAQAGRCYICHEPFRATKPGQRASEPVCDHLEVDGLKIPRALLCVPCNVILGYYEKGWKPLSLIEAFDTYRLEFGC